uniref:Uncharacterized protein n=1 Tax=Antheraea pernyi nuclear polyhedrosis virus TaxID=161494 RepID=Q1HH73_NPVAP
MYNHISINKLLYSVCGRRAALPKNNLPSTCNSSRANKTAGLPCLRKTLRKTLRRSTPPTLKRPSTCRCSSFWSSPTRASTDASVLRWRFKTAATRARTS